MPINFNMIPSLAAKFNPNLSFRNNLPTAPATNRMAASFKQPMPTTPQNQPGYLPDQQPHDDDPAPDFMSQYQKLMGNRPQRLAYQDAVNAGPEEIKRGKWAKLGAAIAAGGSALGGMPADRAAKFGISSYEAPQERADADYQAKVTRLGQSAGMEQQDVQDQLKALEYQQSDWYKRRIDKREQTQTENQTATAKAQMDNWAADNEKQNWMSVPRNDGHTYLVNQKTGVEKDLGSTHLTSAELIKQKTDETVAAETAKQPFEIAADRRRFDQAMAVAKEGTQRAKDVQGMKSADDAAKSAARIREVASKLPNADQIYKNALLAMAVEVGEGRLPPDAPSYLGNKNGVPTVSRGMSFSDESKADEAKIQTWLDGYIKSAQNKGGRAGGPPVPKWIPNPNKPGDTIINPAWKG